MTIVAEFIVFDYRQRLKSFTQSHAVCDDAAIVPFNFIDGSKNAIPLKFVKLLPDLCALNSGLGLDDLVFIQLADKIPEDIE